MICPWALKDEFLKTYHDEEWCRPHHDDTYLFEMLVLEGAQAGLSWSTILKRREGYRKTFFHFDISRCAGMTDEEMEEIGRTAPVIRNRRKNKLCPPKCSRRPRHTKRVGQLFPLPLVFYRK